MDDLILERLGKVFYQLWKEEKHAQGYHLPELCPNYEKPEDKEDVNTNDDLIHCNKCLSNLKDLPPITTDGKSISLLANIELPHEVQAADVHGAEGIGLYRTEYLYLMNNQFPSEEEQYEEYKRTIELMSPRPVSG